MTSCPMNTFLGHKTPLVPLLVSCDANDSIKSTNAFLRYNGLISCNLKRQTDVFVSN